MDVNLRGKVAVITGGTTGIGFATAELFACEGAKVAICSSTQKNVDQAIAALTDKGYDVYGQAVDVSNREEILGFADRVENVFGGIDVWISNAGTFLKMKLIDTPEDEWHKTMDVNLKSVYYGGLIAADKLKKRGGGVLINAASFGALIPVLGSGAYAASKAAVVNMTGSLAGELAPFNIRVVGFIPGLIETPMTADFVATKRDSLASQVALNRLGTPDEVAKVLLFLASDCASYITGTSVEIAGGKFCVQNPANAWA
ncbi:SDR family NAD(P)-dependent oxidoreductase [Paraburkholderia dipogonis]|uniref:SDR family NAD(P)-dependent oxidoreductase n=1 Tax=Paraburkholderia dipogonis TaxID=1211383 RepID=UPI0038BB8A49